MDEGYIKLYRQLMESTIFAHPIGLKIWIWCLIKANRKKKYISLKVGKGYTTVEVNQGQFIFGRFNAEDELNIDGSTVYKWIHKLKEMDMIEIVSNNQYSIITICNWVNYQGELKTKVTTKGQPNNTNVTPKEQPSNTNKNDKNKKNDKNIDIVQNFYDSEIEKSQNNENYINFVNILFGKNSLSKKLDRVLSMPTQVSFEQFQTIDQYKHNHKVTISDYLVSMENYKDLLKKNTTVQGTLLNWIRRDLKRQQ